MAAIRVLIADQTSPEIELCSALFKEPGIVIIGAVTYVQLVDLDLRGLEPDVLVLRIVDVEGLDLLRNICSAHGWLRTVIATSQTDSGLLYRALQAGAQGVVSYRLAGETLGDAVRAVYAGGTFISQDTSTALLNSYLGLGGALTGPLQRLSRRERQVFDLVLEGHTSVQIALQLAISPKSVETYRGRLMAKCGVRNMPGLLHFAVENGLIQ
ncbi:MAG: response regulator transcription factor [Anaerolineae bacterium]